MKFHNLITWETTILLINNFEPVNFNPELQQILYSKKDTIDSNNILYKEIFVYSNTNKDSLFQVNFANVGDGNGNYIFGFFLN